MQSSIISNSLLRRIAHELQAKDILSLMILSKTLYPDEDRNSDSQSPEDVSDGEGAEEEVGSFTPWNFFELQYKAGEYIAFKQDNDQGKYAFVCIYVSYRNTYINI